MKDTVDNFSLGIDDISDEGIDFDQFENDIAQDEENSKHELMTP